MSEDGSVPIPVLPKLPPEKRRRDGEVIDLLAVSAGRSVKGVIKSSIRSLGSVILGAVKYMSGVLIRLVLGIAAVLTFSVVLIYVTADSTSSVMVPPLNTLVATGNNYKISYFQDQDWCESLLAETGSYASSTASTCGDGDKAKPFDALGSDLFAKVRHAAKKAKIAPIRISIQSVQGSVSFAQIDLSCFYCYASYIYSPQTAYQPEEAEKASVTDMSGGWYYVTKGI